MISEHPLILVATSDVSAAKSLEEALESRFRFQTVDSPSNLISTIKEANPSLVVVDGGTAANEGIELCKQIKDSALLSGLPVLVMTPDEAQAESFLSQGATDCLLWPVNAPVARARIRAYLNLSRCVDTLKQVSLIDDLTGVANRRRFEEFLNMEWRRNLRNQTPLSIILLDLDFFTAFNDCYGTAAGDETLQRIATTLGDIVRRPGDLFAWYGRGRFACVLPETDTVGAVSVAEHLRAEIYSLAIPNESSTIAQVLTASLGVGTGVPMNGAEPEDLLTVAERHLFGAKRAGRNQVVFG